MRKKKGFWKHVKSPRAYKIAKKHKKIRGKFLLKTRFNAKKQNKRVKKYGNNIKIKIKSDIYPKQQYIRISKISHYFYDLQKSECNFSPNSTEIAELTTTNQKPKHQRQLSHKSKPVIKQ